LVARGFQVFDKSRGELGYGFDALIQFFEGCLINVFLVERHIKLALNPGSGTKLLAMKGNCMNALLLLLANPSARFDMDKTAALWI